VASGWTQKFLATRGKALDWKNNQQKNKQMSKSYSWRKRMVMSGGKENRVLLGLRKVTATRKIKADSPLTVWITKSEACPNYWCKTRNGLNKEINKGTYTELTALSRS
jgi:hypothetical protein